MDTASVATALHSEQPVVPPEGGKAVEDVLVLVDPDAPKAASKSDSKHAGGQSTGSKQSAIAGDLQLGGALPRPAYVHRLGSLGHSLAYMPF